MGFPGLQLVASPPPARPAAYPWKIFEDLEGPLADLHPGCAVSLKDAQGKPLGSGVFDPGDPVAVWRRFSWEEEIDFDEAYLAGALEEALASRSDEASQRLVNADADFLPGLRADRFGEVLALSLDHPATCAHEAWLVDYFKEVGGAREIVIAAAGQQPKTASGDNLKPFWCEMDGLGFRVDLLSPTCALYPLDLREQHALMGSLCADRRVLDLGAGCGGFSLHAARAGAIDVCAVEPGEAAAKGIGANASKNRTRVDVAREEAKAFLESVVPGNFDVVVVNPEAFAEPVLDLVLRDLPQGGILAVYLRSGRAPLAGFEASVADSFARTGREGRLFARVAQPFDFPVRINFPESQALKGLILEVS